jgi:hypothetical protein
MGAPDQPGFFGQFGGRYFTGGMRGALGALTPVAG